MGLGASSNGPAYQNREYKDLSREERRIYNNRSTDDFDRNILLTLNAVGCNIYFNLNAREKTAFKDLNENNKIYFLAMSDGLRTRYVELEDEGEKAFLLRNYYLDIDTFNRMFVSYRMDVQYRKTRAAFRETREENIRAYEDFRRRFNGIEDDVTELRDDVDTLQTDMTDVKNDVNTLQTDMTNAKGNIKGLAIRTDNLRNNVNDIQARTTNLERNVNRVEDTTDKNTEEINNLKVRQEEDRREKEDMKNFLQERFHYGLKKVNELSSSTSSTSSEIPLQEIETEHLETL